MEMKDTIQELQGKQEELKSEMIKVLNKKDLFIERVRKMLPRSLEIIYGNAIVKYTESGFDGAALTLNPTHVKETIFHAGAEFDLSSAQEGEIALVLLDQLAAFTLWFDDNVSNDDEILKDIMFPMITEIEKIFTVEYDETETNVMTKFNVKFPE